MAAPQAVVIALLLRWDYPHPCRDRGRPLVGAQLLAMKRLLAAPREQAAWYNASGTTLYVLGMLRLRLRGAPPCREFCS